VDREREEEAERKIMEAKRHPPSVQLPKKREKQTQETIPESEKKRIKSSVVEDEDEEIPEESKRLPKRKAILGDDDNEDV